MKIMVIGGHPPYGGGAAYSTQELASGLRLLGHEVLHIAPCQEAKNLVEYPGLIWIAAPTLVGTLKIPEQARAEFEWQILNTYKKHGDFDVVIIGRESFVWHLEAIRQVHSRPVVLICRGGAVNRLAAGEPIEAELKEKLLSLYRSCDLVICIARYLLEALNRVVGMTNAIFLPNPIELPSFEAANSYYPAPGDPIRLIMPARMAQRKRPWDGIEIVRLLKLEGVEVHLTACGGGSEIEEVRSRIHKHNLEQQISLLGNVSREEVFTCLQQAEIAMLCSENEGRPRVLQEAIAANKGIVAYDNPGSREVINEWLPNPWLLGRLVPIGDAVAASKAILDLATYFRSHPEPLPPPLIPNRIDVLYEYESILSRLE